MHLNDHNKNGQSMHITSYFRTIKNFVTVIVTGDSGGIVLYCKKSHSGELLKE